MTITTSFLPLLQCPISHLPVLQQENLLLSADNQHQYRINEAGIPLFAEQFCSKEARQQQAHYDRIAKDYLNNLDYPHTQEYMSYLDEAFLQVTKEASLGQVAEICCGSGEAIRLLGNQMETAVGVDISVSMLEVARQKYPQPHFLFVQGDATQLPLQTGQFDSVFMLGGIHHVNNRQHLFAEIFRILKPGGQFYWREPVSDLFLWRWLRAIIYKVSPALDSDTERPLLYSETVTPLEKAGLPLKVWQTYGFAGYCLLMNSDVLVFNRLFRFLPGIRLLTRMMTKVDDMTVRIPGLTGSGLIVIGMAAKPR
jgi:ubiquinone/menaquinone biosynthesis C-methylase UbiE